jgi:hypothetical protein
MLEGLRFERQVERIWHTISKAWATIRMAISFLPLLRPFIIKEFVKRSMIGHCAFRNRFAAYRPAE